MLCQTLCPWRMSARVLAATNRDLERAVRAGEFRADLFHRLNVYPLRVPSLRDRTDDVPLLAGYFCDLIRRRLGTGPVRLAPETVDALQRYSWPGNARELENVLSRAVLKAASRVDPGDPAILGPGHFGREFSGGRTEKGPEEILLPTPSSSRLPLREAVRSFQRSYIHQALEENGGNWAATARALGVHRGNLHHTAKRLGMK
jgi:anaerobic nitric oxide reductase transcription regulator